MTPQEERAKVWGDELHRQANIPDPMPKLYAWVWDIAIQDGHIPNPQSKRLYEPEIFDLEASRP